MISTRRWLVLFGGAGREAVIQRLCAEGTNIIAIVVPSQKSGKLEHAVSLIEPLGVPIVHVNRASLVEVLSQWSGAGLISVGFPYLVPNDVLAEFSPALNIHPTLLPRYRGPTTAAYIIMNGDTESGSTVHLMTEHMDRGEVVAQSRVALGPFDTVRSMQRKVYASEPELMLEALDRYERGIEPTAQDETLATEYPKRRRPADSEIDPTKPLAELFDEIRAADPSDFPAFFFHRGEKVFIRLRRESVGADDEL
jgi:methionyl-tRNA formyltransferase